MTKASTEKKLNLRQRADEIVRFEGAKSLEAESLYDAQKLVHELRVHKIELEMQNDELRRKQVELESALALYELAPIGYLIFSEKGLVRKANHAAKTMLGMELSVLHKKLISQFFFHDDMVAFDRHYKRLIESGERQDGEMRIVRADGSPFWAHFQVTSLLNGDFGITFTDITERIQLEKSLQNSNERLLELVAEKTYQLTEAQRIAHVGSWEFDLQTKETIWSDEVYRIFGLEPQKAAVTYDILMNCLHPEDRTLINVLYSRSVKEGIPFDISHRIIRRSDGEVRHVHDKCTNVRCKEGRVIKSVGTIQDITELVVKKNALKEYANHVVKMVENEQTRIAQELHDDLGQTLTVLSFAVNQLKRDHSDLIKIQPKLHDMKQSIDQMMESIRRICTTLRPPLLDELGLSAALELLCKNFSRVSSIPCSIVINGCDGDCIDRKGRDCSITIFRLVQESLNNILKHAGASMVAISLCRNDNAVSLEIDDDGCGITSRKRNAGRSFGIIGMRERADSLGAAFDIISERGMGTRVRLVIPCLSREGAV